MLQCGTIQALKLGIEPTKMVVGWGYHVQTLHRNVAGMPVRIGATIPNGPQKKVV